MEGEMEQSEQTEPGDETRDVTRPRDHKCDESDNESVTMEGKGGGSKPPLRYGKSASRLPRKASSSSGSDGGGGRRHATIIMESPLLHRIPPHAETRSADIRSIPTDAKPLQTRPTDTRPNDSRPTDIRPTSKLPKRGSVKHRDVSATRRSNLPSSILKRCASPSADSLRGTIASPPLDDPRVMSPPLDEIYAAQGIIGLPGTSSVGVCCEQCNNCLVEFKRQALKWTFPDNTINTAASKDPDFFKKLEEKLQVSVSHKKFLNRDRCELCDTSVKHLRRDAIAMVRSIEHAQSEPQMVSNISELVGSCNIVPYQSQRHGYPMPNCMPQVPPDTHRYPPIKGHNHVQQTPLAAQAQAYLEQNVRAWMSPKKCNLEQGHNTNGAMNGGDPYHYPPDAYPPGAYPPGAYPPGAYPPGAYPPGAYPPGAAFPPGAYPVPYGYQQAPYPHPMAASHATGIQYIPVDAYQQIGELVYPAHPVHPTHQLMYQSTPPGSPARGNPQSPSAAASFFARAAQKLHMSSKKRRRHQATPELPLYPTRFSQIVKVTPPPAPPCLLRTVGRTPNPGSSKVRVMLRISPTAGHSSHTDSSAQFLSVDPRKKQITVYDPSHCGYATSTSSQRRAGAGTPAPKMFAFDNVFAADDSLAEVCSSGLTEIVQAVVNGADGCLFSYGHAKSGKYETIIGHDESVQTLGVIPCAISWLFRLINEQKDKTGARFSVRVSAVEITGNQEQLKDLLSEVAAQGTETGVGTSPGVYLREDPISGTQLENQSELRAPTADKAAYYLDAALAARSVADEDEARTSHLLFTFHVYQYRVEKANKPGLPAVAGGRSRLHLIHLGSVSRNKDPNTTTTSAGLSLSALGSVILALLNGQRHVPHRESKVAQLLRDSLGNLTCCICMIAHVSSNISHYNETLQVIQLAARVHRMRRRRNKFSSASSEDSSEDSFKMRRFGRGFRGGTMGTLREDMPVTASSDPDCTSSSEQSCDTVIYLGRHGISLSDREVTDNESPPSNVPIMPRTNPRISSKSPRRSGSRSSGDEGSHSDSLTSLYRGHNRFFASSSSLNRIPVRSGSLENTSMSPPSPQMSYAGSSRIKTRCHSDSEDSQFKKPDKAPVMPRTNGNMHYRDREGDFLNEEKWIDGPGAYASPPAGEMWVDGPQCVRNTPPAKPDPKKRTHCKIAPDEKWIDGPSEMIVKPATKIAQISKLNKSDSRNMRANETVKNSTSVKTKTKVEERPISTTSVDSKSSMTVEVGGDTQTLHEEPALEEDCMKPFVRDWVVKHSAISSEATITKGLSYGSKLQNEKQSGRFPAKLSAQNSPRDSPISHRKLKPGVEIQKIGLPPSSSPTLRVAEWVKSVTTSSPSSKQTEPLNVTDQSDSPRTPRLLYNQDGDESTLSVISSSKRTEHDKSFSCGDDLETTQSVNMMDFSCSVSTESASDVGAYDNTNPFCTNRESIYEMQFDEQISKNLASDVENDETFSTHSHGTKDTENSEDPEGNFLAKVSAALNDMTQQAGNLDFTNPVCDKTPSVIPKYNTNSRLRCPDGASNPNIICELENTQITVQTVISSQEKVEEKILGSLSLEEKNRIADGQSERDSAIEALRAEMKAGKKCKLNNKSKPPVPQKVASDKPSGLPKFLSKSTAKSKDDKKTCTKPPSSNIPSLSHTSRKDKPNKSDKSPSSQRSNSQPSISSPSSNSTRSSKESSASPSHSRLPIFNKASKDTKISSKTYKTSSLSRKDKDKVVSFNVYNCRIGEIGHRATDSDSGNDSGIVANEHKKLLSPYATVGKPRTPSHSSGHGSDNSSTISADVVAKSVLQTTEKVQGGTSSGYESMMRDSEATGTSSSNHDDTASESSNSDKQKVDKKGKNTRRSRSVPSRSDDDSYLKSPKHQDASSKAWIDTRSIDKFRDEPMELQSYEMDDINRMQQRRRLEEAEQEVLLEKEKIKELLGEQIDAADETTPMKEDLITDRSAWFDCKSLLCFSCRSNTSDTSSK